MKYNGYVIPEDAATERRFEDVDLKSDSELAELSALVQEESIFLGSEGYLEGNGTMQRRHMALGLVRSIKSVYGVDLVNDYKAANFTPTVKDLDKAGGIEQKEAIIALDYADLTNVEVFNPSGTITRGQFVAFLHRTIEKYNLDGEVQQLPSEPLQGTGMITIPQGTPLYASRNLKNEIGNWQGGNLPVSFTAIELGRIIVVNVAGEKFYLHSNAATLQPALPIVEARKPIGAVRTSKIHTPSWTDQTVKSC